MTAQTKLAAMGYSMQEAKEYLLAHVANPHLIAEKSAQIGLNIADLAQIVNLSTNEVADYFAISGLDVNEVNAQKTNLSLISDLASGDVYLYDPIAAKGQKAFSFGTQITDIATAYNGDIYATSFNALYRYDFDSKTVTKVTSVSYGTNSLTLYGSQFITASNADSVVRFLDANGQQEAAYQLPGGPAGGDLVVEGNYLYRTTAQGIVRTDMQTGVTNLEAGEVGTKYHGLAEATWGWIVGYADDRDVKAYNPATQDVMNLPKLSLAGVTPSGATEALQMHAQAWG